DGIVLDAAQLTGKIGQWPCDTAVNVHFRSEEARLCSPDRPDDGCLVLRGEVVQCSYPGGFYRYTVRIGSRQYLVDDSRKLPIGETIGIALPATALHIYPTAYQAKGGEMERLSILVTVLVGVVIGQCAASEAFGAERGTLNLVTAGDQNM